MNREEPSPLDPPTAVGAQAATGGAQAQTNAGALEIRPPAACDAAGVWKLVDATPALDTNSRKAYRLLCTHFADTGLVAYLGSGLVGFVLGYPRPDDGATAFVWQMGVAGEARGRGLGAHLLAAWFARCARRSDVRFLEATVAPGNQASRALLSSFAARHGAPIHERVAYPAAVLPEGADPESEIAVRVGPVPLSRAFALPHQESI